MQREVLIWAAFTNGFSNGHFYFLYRESFVLKKKAFFIRKRKKTNANLSKLAFLLQMSLRGNRTITFLFWLNV